MVLATGTNEPTLPFPGWDLPGVTTAGAASALLASQGMTVGGRALVGGTGPLLLPVAAALAEAGARDLTAASAATGCGTGYCQARVCGPPLQYAAETPHI